jgi:hypothetical protein
LNQNLFNILGTLSPEEWDSLGKFISSPYFVKKRNYFIIYKLLKRFYTEGRKDKDLNEVSLLKKLYKIADPHSQTLHNRLSEFCRIVEKFLIQKNFERQNLDSLNCLMEEFIERKLPRNFKSKINEAEKLIYEDNYNAENFYTKGMIFNLEASYFQMTGDLNSAYRKFDRNSEYFLAYFLDRLFYFAVEMYSLEQSVFKFDFNTVIELMKSMDYEKFIKNLERQKIPVFVSCIIRFYLYKAFTNPGKKKYIEKVKSVYSGNKSNLNDTFKTSFYLQLESFYVNLINQGKSEFERELFMVYREKLEQGIYKDLLKIYYPSQNFRDYVIIGLRVGEPEWVEKFIAEYAPKLPEIIREDEYVIAKVRVLIYKSEYNKALKILQKHKSSKHVHIIDISRLKLRLFYELSMYEKIYLETDNLKHFIKKSKASSLLVSNTKEYLSKFSELMKLINATPKDRKIQAEEFIEALEKNKKNISEKSWFLEKAKLLLKN